MNACLIALVNTIYTTLIVANGAGLLALAVSIAEVAMKTEKDLSCVDWPCISASATVTAIFIAYLSLQLAAFKVFRRKRTWIVFEVHQQQGPKKDAAENKGLTFILISSCNGHFRRHDTYHKVQLSTTSAA